MIVELVQAFSLIFIAEMGDKTQILAMAFASKYKIKQVLLGVFLGSLFNHALAVLLGSNLQRIIPLQTLSIIAGFSFIVFGLWNLKIETDEDERKVSKYGPVLTVSLAFFIGELGDKTQLTAIALSTDASYPILILVGTVLGMIFTSLIGIVIGLKIGNKIDEFYIKIGASIIFLVFGYIKLFSSLPNEFITIYSIVGFTVIVLAISTGLLVPGLRIRKEQQQTKYQQVAQRLYAYYNDIDVDINDICLGEGTCGLCEGNSCPIGFTKDILKVAINTEEIREIYSKVLLSEKVFDLDKVRSSLRKTIEVLESDWNSKEFQEVHKIRHNLEFILFKERISVKSFEDYKTELLKKDSTFKNL